MKKSILISTIIGALIFMTSCLGEVSNNYADTSFVYIDTDDVGTTYGKTISPYSPSRVIVANEMIMMNRGDIKIMSYSWDEEYGTKPLSVDGQVYEADLVRLTEESAVVNQTVLRMSELPVVEEPLSFIEIANPIYAPSSAEYMGDKWLFQYSYEVAKGQTGIVEFFKRNAEEGSDNIVIDVLLSHAGTADGTTVERKSDFLALDMSALRMQYGGTNIKTLYIKFVYHVKGHTQPVESEKYELKLDIEQ